MSDTTRSQLPLVALVCHGSRDPRYQQAFTDLVTTCRHHLFPQPVIGGQLELAEPPLEQQLIQAVQSTAAQTLILIPLFFGGGVHVNQDLPAILHTLSRAHPQLRVLQTPPLGQDPAVIPLLQSRLKTHHRAATATASILVGHGSRSAGFAQILQKIATGLAGSGPITTAFWAQPPYLPDQIGHLYDQGFRQLQILPCFLFPGGILDRIEDIARQWQTETTDLQIRVEHPLLPDPAMTQAILSQIQRSSRQLRWASPSIGMEV